MNVQMKISDIQLLQTTKNIALQEQMKILELLKYLTEIDRRMAYVKLGYTSLFSYLMQELGYSGSEAALRVNAMRLLKKVPEAQAKIATGTLTLSTAASIQSFAHTEKVDVKELVAECEHKSTREVTKILEEKRVVKKIEFTVKLTGQAAEKFARLKKLFPDLNDVELLESAVEEKLTRIKLGDKKSEKSEETTKLNPQQKSIPRSTLRTLFTRAQNHCEHIDLKTQKRCSSQTNLQSDHIYPKAWGGTHEITNLRILCRTHNLASAHACFGTDKMAKMKNQSLGK